MRKWIVIAVVVLVAAGAFGLLFRPWKTSIEYHKRGYAAACRGYTRIDMARYGWAHLTGRLPNTTAQDNRRAKRIALHERALINAGYLEERTFVPQAAMFKAINAWYARFPTNNVSMTVFYTNTFILGGTERAVIARTYLHQRTNAFVIVTPREEMRLWENLISEADERAVVKSE